MNDPTLGSSALAIARHLLDRVDVTTVVAPTVADLRFEHAERLATGDGRGALRIRVAGYVTLTRLIGQLHVRARWRRLASRAPWLLVASVGASLVAAPALSVEARTLATSQLAYVAVGVAVATTLATTTARTLRRAGWLALTGVLLPLVVVTCFGEAHAGARRWLAVGPLHLHVAALVAPAWAIAAACLVASPRRLLVACFAALALLVLTRDLGAVVLYAAVAVAAARSRVRWLRPALATTGVVASAAAASRQPVLSPVRHVEGVMSLVGASGPGAVLAAVGALAAIVIGAAALARRVPGGFPARTAQAIATYLLVASVGGFLLGGALPFVSYGGSSIVGGMAMIGVLASLEGARPGSKLGRG